MSQLAQKTAYVMAQQAARLADEVARMLPAHDGGAAPYTEAHRLATYLNVYALGIADEIGNSVAAETLRVATARALYEATRLTAAYWQGRALRRFTGTLEMFAGSGDGPGFVAHAEATKRRTAEQEAANLRVLVEVHNDLVSSVAAVRMVVATLLPPEPEVAP